MMKKKQTCFVYCIPIDIYGDSIPVHISNDKLYLAQLEKKYKCQIDKQYLGFTFEGKYTPLIWLRYKPNTPARIGTLAHEAAHAALMILKSRGVNLNTYTDEPYAYLVGYLVERTLKEIKNSDKSNKT